MKNLKFLIILLAFIILCNLQATQAYDDEKINLYKHNHFITDKKTILKIKNKYFFVKKIQKDSYGIFCYVKDLDRITDRCFNGHKIYCVECWGCQLSAI